MRSTARAAIIMVLVLAACTSSHHAATAAPAPASTTTATTTAPTFTSPPSTIVAFTGCHYVTASDNSGDAWWERPDSHQRYEPGCYIPAQPVAPNDANCTFAVNQDDPRQGWWTLTSPTGLSPVHYPTEKA